MATVEEMLMEMREFLSRSLLDSRAYILSDLLLTPTTHGRVGAVVHIYTVFVELKLTRRLIKTQAILTGFFCGVIKSIKLTKRQQTVRQNPCGF